MIKKVHIFISGKVQGVFFRHEAKLHAKNLYINGWLKNLPDKRVEIVAQGEEENLKEFIDWCVNGPKDSKVENIKYMWKTPNNVDNGFEIVS